MENPMQDVVKIGAKSAAARLVDEGLAAVRCPLLWPRFGGRCRPK